MVVISDGSVQEGYADPDEAVTATIIDEWDPSVELRYRAGGKKERAEAGRGGSRHSPHTGGVGEMR